MATCYFVINCELYIEYFVCYAFSLGDHINLYYLSKLQTMIISQETLILFLTSALYENN